MLLAGAAAYAHHSYAATYDISKEVKLDGKLMQFSLRNPAFLRDHPGAGHQGSHATLGRGMGGHLPAGQPGITQETLKIGDEITIVGRPPRVPGEFRLLMVNLKRPLDGFSWGSRPGEVVD